MTIQLTDGVYWINDCYPIDEGSDTHLHASAYLVRDDGRDVLVDTGAFYNQEDIQGAIEELTGPDGVDAMIISKAHPPHAANLAHFRDEWNDPEIVATSGPPEIYGFVASYTKTALKTKEGEPMNVAGRPFTFIDPPLLDLAHSSWILHETTGALFTADGFGHYHRDGECALTSSEFDGGIGFEDVRGFHRDMLKWLKFINPEELTRAITDIYDRHDVSLIAPIHGNPVMGEDIDAYMDTFYHSVDEIAAAFP
jgi:flavorubredoxin